MLHSSVTQRFSDAVVEFTRVSAARNVANVAIRQTGFGPQGINDRSGNTGRF